MGLLSDLKQNLKKGIESTSQRSKKLMEISRLMIAIKGKKEEEERIYLQLGRESYHLWAKKEQWVVTDSIRASLQQIRAIREQIEQWEREVAELKKQEEKERKAQEQEQDPSPPKGDTDAKSTTVQTPPPPPGSSVRDLGADSLTLLEGQAIFICPHCGEQVREDATVCPHCQKHMYHDD